MTVSTEVDHNEYTGNGVTTSFPYTFRIFKKTDLVVQVSDLNGNVTELVLDTGYTVTGAGTYSGGSVVLPSPLAAGWRITIDRVLDVVQETDLRNQGKFFPEVHRLSIFHFTRESIPVKHFPLPLQSGWGSMGCPFPLLALPSGVPGPCGRR